MKKWTIIITLALISVLVFALCACGESTDSTSYDDSSLSNNSSSDNDTSTSSNTTEPETAYSKLNKDEQDLFFALKSFAKKAIEPSSVTVIDIRYGYDNADDSKARDESKKTFFVKLSAKNSLGGTVTKAYTYTGYSLSEGGSAWYDVAFSTSKASPAKLNAALKEYYKEQGWI